MTLSDSTRHQADRHPGHFLALLAVLSLPLWWLGWAAGYRRWLPIDLPISALMAINPALAALILVARRDGRAGVGRLLRRAFDWSRVERRVWWLPALLLWPAIVGASYLVLRLRGIPLPPGHFPLLTIGGLAGLFLLGGLGEELGWQGYLFEPLQERWGALGAAMLIGTVWGAWHLVPFTQSDRSSSWIAWQTVDMIPFRVLTAWLYQNSGRSVFVAGLFHASANLSQFLFPDLGSGYDPRLAGLMLFGLAAAVIAIWGPGTLGGRHRAADPPTVAPGSG